MHDPRDDQELYHEIFGSILDRIEMTPFLLLPARDYATALRQAAQMMANRGFDTQGSDALPPGERERAARYIERSYGVLFDGILPFVTRQLEGLAALGSPNRDIYRACIDAVEAAAAILRDPAFRRLVAEDPRHLFLLASSRKYPFVFAGHAGGPAEVPLSWQRAACSLLKTAHLVKSIEEDSQDINDYAQLGYFLQAEGQRLDDLFRYDWDRPAHVPDNEPAQRAFAKLASFFHRLRESLAADGGRLLFRSGDGVDVEIAEVKARLKSPESMVTKLGKNVEGEAYDIRDILAITFILRSSDDTLKLVHALQKRGVILQENTESHSITQTLYDGPESMRPAVRKLMVSLAKSGGGAAAPDEEEVAQRSREVYEALSRNAAKNEHTSQGHRKFQCKIAFSLPVHRSSATNAILVPGTREYAERDRVPKRTEQHTLGVELRISDVESWRASEQTGDSHHDAYKFRQLVAVLQRVFRHEFVIPRENMAQLRKDQARLFA